jgi:2-iminobutanoate/2-iminopropanoate deaminase
MPREAYTSNEIAPPVGPFSSAVRAAGKALDDVVRVSVYLTDMKDFPHLNAVYERYFKAPYPARTTIAVAALPLGAAVEIDLVAR